MNGSTLDIRGIVQNGIENTLNNSNISVFIHADDIVSDAMHEDILASIENSP